jgi:hypothetical protein
MTIKTLEELHPYIRPHQHQTSDKGSQTTLRYTYSLRPQHNALAPR